MLINHPTLSEIDSASATKYLQQIGRMRIVEQQAVKQWSQLSFGVLFVGLDF